MTGKEGRLSWEARAEEVSFEVLPKICKCLKVEKCLIDL